MNMWWFIAPDQAGWEPKVSYHQSIRVFRAINLLLSLFPTIINTALNKMRSTCILQLRVLDGILTVDWVKGRGDLISGAAISEHYHLHNSKQCWKLD
jgi:hypothetical protein